MDNTVKHAFIVKTDTKTYTYHVMQIWAINNGFHELTNSLKCSLGHASTIFPVIVHKTVSTVKYKNAKLH